MGSKGAKERLVKRNVSFLYVCLVADAKDFRFLTLNLTEKLIINSISPRPRNVCRILMVIPPMRCYMVAVVAQLDGDNLAV